MGAQSKCSVLKSTLVSSLEIVNISCTIVSSVAATSKDRARYFSWSLYAPIPNSIPSNWPLIMVIGVFSSWEAEEKKSCCARSSAFWCSISFWSWRFALCNSSKVADSFRDSVLYNSGYYWSWSILRLPTCSTAHNGGKCRICCPWTPGATVSFLP